jgi:hypothetical protein
MMCWLERAEMPFAVVGEATCGVERPTRIELA